MSRSASARVMLTVDEFSVYDTPDGKAELVRGELRVNPPPSAGHSLVILELLMRLVPHVREQRLGLVFTNSSLELSCSRHFDGNRAGTRWASIDATSKPRSCSSLKIPFSPE
jgi:hypothetical protein